MKDQKTNLSYFWWPDTWDLLLTMSENKAHDHRSIFNDFHKSHVFKNLAQGIPFIDYYSILRSSNDAQHLPIAKGAKNKNFTHLSKYF